MLAAMLMTSVQFRSLVRKIGGKGGNQRDGAGFLALPDQINGHTNDDDAHTGLHAGNDGGAREIHNALEQAQAAQNYHDHTAVNTMLMRSRKFLPTLPARTMVSP